MVSRPGKGREPWYLLTNEPVLTAADAWRVVFAYASRWQIEMSFRYGKSELAMESPRLWRWENRLKLLMMVTFVYAFLLSLLDPSHQLLRQWLLRWWCHQLRITAMERGTEKPQFLFTVCVQLSAVCGLTTVHLRLPSSSCENSG